MASTIWRGYITFGLITIPVRLFRAARPERVSLRKLYRAEAAAEPEAGEPAYVEPPRPERALKAVPAKSHLQSIEPEEQVRSQPQPSLAPLQQVAVRQGTDEPVPAQSVVKGFEYEKNRFVAIEPEELKSLQPKTSPGMEIQEFVALSEIDPVYFETSYYVTPEEAGEKAYSLLYRSMQTTGLVAIAQFAMHSREHVVVVRPGKNGLLAHTMFFASEVRAEEEHRADISAVKEKELGLAETLIRSLTASFEPEKYRDAYRERLESIIAEKVKGQPQTPVATGVSKPAEVVDFAEALRKSLAQLKKPAQSEQPAAKSQAAAVGHPKKASRTRNPK